MDYPKSVPNVGLVGGKFVDENTSTGQVGSLIPATWGNAVTDEILAVIEASGMLPDETDNTQLKSAIIRLVEQGLPELPLEATPDKPGLVVLATEEEAVAGENDRKAMTPLRVFQAIRAWVAQATETVAGLTRVATQDEVDAGESDEAFVSPKKMLFGFSYTDDGFILPRCLGGFVVQWMVFDIAPSTSRIVPLPIPLQKHLITLPSVLGNPSGPNIGFNISTDSALDAVTVYLSSSNINPDPSFRVNLLVVGR